MIGPMLPKPSFLMPSLATRNAPKTRIVKLPKFLCLTWVWVQNACNMYPANKMYFLLWVQPRHGRDSAGYVLDMGEKKKKRKTKRFSLFLRQEKNPKYVPVRFLKSTLQQPQPVLCPSFSSFSHSAALSF